MVIRTSSKKTKQNKTSLMVRMVSNSQESDECQGGRLVGAPLALLELKSGLCVLEHP